MILQLKELRKKRGLTQFELGLKLDPPVYPRAVARWESGKSVPRQNRLTQLAAALRVPIWELFSDNTVEGGHVTVGTW